MCIGQKIDFDAIAKYYGKCQSIKQTAMQFEISEYKIRRILIERGLFETPIISKIKQCYADGKTPNEIAAICHVSKHVVENALPYQRCVYGHEQSQLAIYQQQRRRKIKEERKTPDQR